MHCALISICARLSWDSITQRASVVRASNAMAWLRCPRDWPAPAITVHPAARPAGLVGTLATPPRDTDASEAPQTR